MNLVLDKERAAAYGIDRAPAMVLLADGVDTRIRFLGVPAGYDFMSLVDAILAVSGASDMALSEAASRSWPASRRRRPFRCSSHRRDSHCPRAVGLANRMAAGEHEHHGDDRAGDRVL